MKVKHLLLTATVFTLGVFIFQSCTKEYGNEIAKQEITDLLQGAEKTAVYCRYNVASSEAEPGETLPDYLAVGSIVCLPCDEPCAKKVTDYPVNNAAGKKIAKFSGTRSSKKCKKCGSGTVIN